MFPITRNFRLVILSASVEHIDSHDDECNFQIYILHISHYNTNIAFEHIFDGHDDHVASKWEQMYTLMTANEYVDTD